VRDGAAGGARGFSGWIPFCKGHFAHRKRNDRPRSFCGWGFPTIAGIGGVLRQIKTAPRLAPIPVVVNDGSRRDRAISGEQHNWGRGILDAGEIFRI